MRQSNLPSPKENMMSYSGWSTPVYSFTKNEVIIKNNAAPKQAAVNLNNKKRTLKDTTYSDSSSLSSVFLKILERKEVISKILLFDSVLAVILSISKTSPYRF